MIALVIFLLAVLAAIKIGVILFLVLRLLNKKKE